MAELLVIRHGQASFGAGDARDYDRLSELGQRQSASVGAHLARTGWVPDRVVTGTLDRHAQTWEAMGLTGSSEQHAGFNEYDFHDLLSARFPGGVPGDVVGDRKTHFRTLRDVILDWQAGGVAGAAESWADFTARVAAALGFATDTEAKRVLVVSSGGVIGQLVASTLSAPAAMMIQLNLQVKNTSITRFVFSKGRIMLTEFNAAPHFEATPDLLSYS